MKSLPLQHMIRISFDSAHGGFGTRDGQMLTQAITPHKMNIIVSDGHVISAITDETWDELNSQYVLKKPESKLPSTDEQITPFEGKATDYSSLIDAIKSRGVLVKPVGEISSESSSFSIPTKVISVGGSNVQIFEFASESDAKAASLTVSEDGTKIGTSIIAWIDTPHFYTSGKLVVLYVGQNPELVNLLESFLGKQFAGMQIGTQTVNTESLQNEFVIERASFLPGTTLGGTLTVEGNYLNMKIQSYPDDVPLQISLKNNDSNYVWEKEVSGDQTITINDIKDKFLDLRIQNNSEKTVSFKAIIVGANSPTTDGVKEKEAIDIIKKQNSQFQTFPSDDLPPKIILTKKASNGWYVIFETQGSGIPIIEAHCFLVDDSKTVTPIGHYTPGMGDIKTTISFDTCS